MVIETKDLVASQPLGQSIRLPRLSCHIYTAPQQAPTCRNMYRKGSSEGYKFFDYTCLPQLRVTELSFQENKRKKASLTLSRVQIVNYHHHCKLLILGINADRGCIKGPPQACEGVDIKGGLHGCLEIIDHCQLKVSLLRIKFPRVEQGRDMSPLFLIYQRLMLTVPFLEHN